MAGHEFELRADLQYSGGDNRIDGLDAEVLTDDGWQPLQIDNRTPGFLMFVYAFLICQHTYFHANSGESWLRLVEASATLLLQTDHEWKIERIRVGIAAKLRDGFVEGNATITTGVFVDHGQVQWQAVGPVGGGPPDDSMPAINFFIDPAVDLSPFRLLAGITNGVFSPLWELDFSKVTGSLGSPNLAGLVAHGVDANGVRTGVEFQVNPFTLQAVPIPAAIWLFGTALVGLVGIGKRKKAT